MFQRSTGWDIRHAGPFQTLGCGAYHNGNLAIILNQLITDLVPIIQDAKDSATTPSAAYSIFFKNPKNAPFVAEILTNVSTGAIMRPPVANSSTGGPTIVCPKPGRSFHIELPRGATIDAAVYCASRGASVAAYLNPTPIIMLCPNFFTRVAGPPTPVVGICPKFNQATNRFKRLSTDGTVDGASVVHSQMWVLLEEMVHYYIVTSRVKRNSPEAYDINKAWLLSARKSLGNAVSYGYYAASVHNKCSDWPVVSSDGRELVEVVSESDNPAQDGSSASERGYGGLLEVEDVELLSGINGTLSL